MATRKNAKEWAEQVQADPCASYWLKEALTVMFDRDPLDALRDADLLRRIMQRHEAECCEKLERGLDV